MRVEDMRFTVQAGAWGLAAEPSNVSSFVSVICWIHPTAVVVASEAVQGGNMVYRTNVSYITHFLREVDMFSGLSERNLDRIASLCEEHTFAPEEHLGMQDERGTRLYVIRDGEITVTVGSQDTGVVVRTVRGRETFPIAVLMEPPILVTTTQAVTEVNAYVIPRVRLMELCELEPEIGMHIYRASCSIIMNRYRYTLAMLSDSVGHPTRLNPVWRGAEV